MKTITPRKMSMGCRRMGSLKKARCVSYRGTSLISNTHPPRTTIGPKVQVCCRILRGGGVRMSEVPLSKC